MKILLSLLFTVLIFSCSEAEQINEVDPVDSSLYFPPNTEQTWETLSPDNIGWNSNEIPELINYLENTNTKAFIVLKNGRIVIEHYFNGATINTLNPWFSAGKTLVAFTAGIANSENYLTLTDPSNTYLGSGWSNLTLAQENAITVEHHLSMTTGLDYTEDIWCTDPECLNYLNPPNSFWYYHNAPFTLLQDVISGATNLNFDDYFNTKLRDKIGMDGHWISIGYNRPFRSTARSMARFGLLIQNRGIWKNEDLLGNLNYFDAMINSSQNLNPAYGYLWWLNGKQSYRLPSSTDSFNGKLIPNAPDDLIAGLGANDQKLYVVPSQDLVIVRMGGATGTETLGPSGFDNQLWAYINAVIN